MIELNADRIELNLPKVFSVLQPAVVDDLVRVGGEFDGGYVVPSSVLKRSHGLLSLGLSEDWSFDLDFLRFSPNAAIHCYDHTVSRKYFYRRLKRSAWRFLFGKENLKTMLHNSRVLKSYDEFFGERAVHFCQRVHYKICSESDATLDVAIERLGCENIFLKMDIEGSEYRVADQVIRNSDRIIGMAIEFHDVGTFRETFLTVIERICQLFDIVHLHVNNCGEVTNDGIPEVLEITFARKGIFNTDTKRYKLPLDLDNANSPSQIDYSLTFQST